MKIAVLSLIAVFSLLAGVANAGTCDNPIDLTLDASTDVTYMPSQNEEWIRFVAPTCDLYVINLEFQAAPPDDLEAETYMNCGREEIDTVVLDLEANPQQEIVFLGAGEDYILHVFGNTPSPFPVRFTVNRYTAIPENFGTILEGESGPDEDGGPNYEMWIDAINFNKSGSTINGQRYTIAEIAGQLYFWSQMQYQFSPSFAPISDPVTVPSCTNPTATQQDNVFFFEYQPTGANFPITFYSALLDLNTGSFGNIYTITLNLL